MACKNSLAVKKTQPSKVESYLKDECMVQGWSYQFISGQVEPEASEGSQYWEAELLKNVWYRFLKIKKSSNSQLPNAAHARGVWGHASPGKV